MVKYHEVAVEVEPKIVTLRGAEAELRAATKEQDAALALLAEVQGNLDAQQVLPALCRHFAVRRTCTPTHPPIGKQLLNLLSYGTVLSRSQ